MKKIEAIIRKTKFEDVKEALLNSDIDWFEYHDVHGIGQSRQERIYRGVMYSTDVIERVAISHIFLTTNLAAAAGGTATMFLTWLKYGKPSLSFTLNGVLAGLVGITAGCDVVSPVGAVLIGFILSDTRFRRSDSQSRFKEAVSPLRSWFQV